MTANKSVKMATRVDNSQTVGTIEKPRAESDMDKSEAGEASVAAGHRSGKTTTLFLELACEQWERKNNGKRLRNEISEPVSARADWRSRME